MADVDAKKNVSDADTEAPQKKGGCDWFLISINLIYFLACATYSIIAPFYPIVAREKGFGDAFIGILIGIYPIIGIITTLFLPKLITKFGRKQLMFVGGLIEVVAVILFGFTIYFDDVGFIVVSVIGRVFMGLGGSIILTASLSCITFFYDNQSLETKIASMEFGGQVGILLGPVIGAGLFSFADYVGTFSIFAGILLIGVVLLFIFNHTEKNYDPDTKELAEDVNQCKVAVYPRICTVLFFVIFGLAGPVYLEAVSANYLHSMGVSKLYIGFIFAIQMIGYLIAWGFFMLGKRFDRRVIMIVGAWIEIFGCLLIGPVIPVDSHIGWTIAGMFVMGAGSALCYLPTLPYMIKCAEKKFEDAKKEDLSDVLSAIFGTCHYIGETVGPLYSGIMTEVIGFRYAAGIFAAIIFIYSVFFGWYCDFWKVLCTCSCIAPKEELNQPLLGNDNEGIAQGNQKDTTASSAVAPTEDEKANQLK